VQRRCGRIQPACGGAYFCRVPASVGKSLPLRGPAGNSHGAPSRLPDGRILYRLRRRWRDGTSQVIFTPLDLIGKLAAMVRPPRFNLVRYHGVLAPSARWRREIVPSAPADECGEHGCGNAATSDRLKKKDGYRDDRRPRNYPWAMRLGLPVRPPPVSSAIRTDL
jgi:hypothetical protein